jgi:hypothetical protein
VDDEKIRELVKQLDGIEKEKRKMVITTMNPYTLIIGLIIWFEIMINLRLLLFS